MQVVTVFPPLKETGCSVQLRDEIRNLERREVRGAKRESHKGPLTQIFSQELNEQNTDGGTRPAL